MNEHFEFEKSQLNDQTFGTRNLFHFIVCFCILLYIDANVEDAEKPQKFGDSWSKPIRQVSLAYDSSKLIGALGTDTNDKTEDESRKKEMPARNSWSVGLLDSEPKSESIVSDSKGEEEPCIESIPQDNEITASKFWKKYQN